MSYDAQCGIVRDLIPLAVDGAACEQSRKLVEDHILECAECRRIMDDMRAEIRSERVDEENTRFILFCRKMQRAFTWRRLIKAFVAAVLIVGFLVGGVTYTHHQMYVAGMEIKPAEYSAAVDQDGFFVFRFKSPKNRAVYGYTLYFDQGICYYAPTISAWPQFFENLEERQIEDVADMLRMKDGVLMYVDYEESVVRDEESGMHVSKWEIHYTPIQELRLGTREDYDVVYRVGDELPEVYIERGTN